MNPNIYFYSSYFNLVINKEVKRQVVERVNKEPMLHYYTLFVHLLTADIFSVLNAKQPSLDAIAMCVGTAHMRDKEGGAHPGGGAHKEGGVGPAHTEQSRDNDIVDEGAMNCKPLS